MFSARPILAPALAALLLAGATHATAQSTPPAAPAGEAAPQAKDKIDVAALPATGETRRCLPLGSIRSTQPVNDKVIMVRTGTNSWYRNDLRTACSALRHDSTIVHKPTSGMMCEMDIIQLVDPTSRMGFGSCSLGAFTPVEVPRGASFRK